ncbi:ROK family protein [Pseudactinotalea sp.]|uniref:ROK family transcriptional regulator n=1 Tax=Pseudactinotalea sp. TaxID=1926260 RepID=UPI003B3A1CAC
MHGRPRAGTSRRDAHEAQLLAHLRAHGATDRADLADALGLSRATVSTLTRDLLAAGALGVTSSGSRRRTGRRPELLTLNPRAGVLVGIDLGHTHVTVAAADAAHVIVGTRTRPCAAATPWDERARTAIAMVRALLSSADRPRLLGIGAGIAGSIDHRDNVVADTRTRLETAFSVPVLVDNNTRLAGLAEHVWGVARDLRDAIYLRLAAGVGGAIILDGGMRLGARNLAGELGHVSVTDEPLACRCGKRGCLETVAGRGALLNAAGTESLDQLTDALTAGDERAVAAVARAGAATGRVLAGACTTLDVTDVVVAGELTVLGEVLLGPLRAALTEHSLPTGTGTRLHLAQLGQPAGALGGIGALLREETLPLPLTAAAS